jgi:ABC-type lipoprotein export system ATPase subunit
LQFGKTILMVTHDSRAEKYADEVHRLDKGLLLDRPAVPQSRKQAT